MKRRRKLHIIRTQYLQLENFSKFQRICGYYNVSVSSVLDNFIRDYVELHSHVLKQLEAQMFLPHPGEPQKRSGRKCRGLVPTSMPDLVNEIGKGIVQDLPGLKDL